MMKTDWLVPFLPFIDGNFPVATSEGMAIAYSFKYPIRNVYCAALGHEGRVYSFQWVINRDLIRFVVLSQEKFFCSPWRSPEGKPRTASDFLHEMELALIRNDLWIPMSDPDTDPDTDPGGE